MIDGRSVLDRRRLRIRYPAIEAEMIRRRRNDAPGIEIQRMTDGNFDPGCPLGRSSHWIGAMGDPNLEHPGDLSVGKGRNVRDSFW
jgi:hypothetical protein